MAGYKVVVAKDYLVFAAGHFITYGGICESLHGHNYRARVELEGELDENSYVFDFVALKRIVRRVVEEVDHKMLLPLENPHLELVEEGGDDGQFLFHAVGVALDEVPDRRLELEGRQQLPQPAPAFGRPHPEDVGDEVQVLPTGEALIKPGFVRDITDRAFDD